MIYLYTNFPIKMSVCVGKSLFRTSPATFIKALQNPLLSGAQRDK